MHGYACSHALMATVACAMRARERGDGLRADGMWDARLGGRIAVILVGGSEARAGKSPTAEHRKVDLHTHEHLYLCTQGCTQYYSPPTSICALRSLGLTVPAVSVCLLCAQHLVALSGVGLHWGKRFTAEHGDTMDSPQMETGTRE
jgi:hypothetical protein